MRRCLEALLAELSERRAFIKEVGVLKYLARNAVRQFYKRIIRRDHLLGLPGGETILLPVESHFATEAYVTNADVDWGSEKLLYSLLTCRGAFLDIGANIGYYSVYMAPRVMAVYCFEPDPRPRRFLARNVGRNPKAHIIPIAVGKVPGKAFFTLERTSELSHLSKAEEVVKGIEVDVTSVDEFVGTHRIQVEAIKIDAEGHDHEILCGAIRVLKEQEPIVLTEAQPTKALLDLAVSVAYRVFAYIRNPRSRARTFVEIISDCQIYGETKMLFLVPHRLCETIQKLA